MQNEFIGHGLNTSNKLNVGAQLATSFKSPQFDSFIGFVAFVAISGVSKSFLLQKNIYILPL